MNEIPFLLVNESKTELKKIAACIARLGYRNILVSKSADRAWVILRSKPVRCVICAYDMKEMSGLALLKIVRREACCASIPFFLTDKAFTTLKVLQAGQSGVTGLLVSPYNPDTLKIKLDAAFGKRSEPVVDKARNDYEKGQELIEKKQYDQALEVFDTLVNQKENPEYYFNIGYIMTMQGKHSEAIEAFSKATQLDRLFAKAYEEMGRAYRALGQMDKAEECMEKAAEIYLDKDKISDAEDILNELVASGSRSLNVFNSLGVIYRKKGDPRAALRYYRKALRVHQDEPYIYYNIGRLYLELKETSNARAHFQTALDLDASFDHARQVINAIDLGMV